jgi:1-acyl-sn-glycerol-3-phosphate acyltransferase
MREALITRILEFIGDQDLLGLEDIRTALEREIDGAGPSALLALKDCLSADLGWSYYPPDPLARNIHHLLADRFLGADSRLDGIEHLARVDGAPVAIMANHLSYADANLLEVLLHRSGLDRLSQRLTAIAGPKVFTDRHRRFSSLCFGTVKVPQSAEVASEDAVLSPRAVASAARRAIEVAHARLRQGDALVLFGEGTRSRLAAMQRMLPAVARYLEMPGVVVVPAGLTGAEDLFGIADSSPRPARISVRVGAPISAEALLAQSPRDRRLVIDAIGLAIADLLPSAYRGAYGSGDFADAARLLARARVS